FMLVRLSRRVPVRFVPHRADHLWRDLQVAAWASAQVGTVLKDRCDVNVASQGQFTGLPPAPPPESSSPAARVLVPPRRARRYSSAASTPAPDRAPPERGYNSIAPESPHTARWRAPGLRRSPD